VAWLPGGRFLLLCMTLVGVFRLDVFDISSQQLKQYLKRAMYFKLSEEAIQVSQPALRSFALLDRLV
jgi:Tol biopolymer transport system component